MENRKGINNWILYILAGIIIILLIWLLVNSNRKIPISVDNPYSYLPDTVYVDSDYSKEIKELRDKVSDLAKTPPKVIYHYDKPNNTTTKIEKIPDSIILYIAELQKRLAISDQYLKNYPENDKLIDMQLFREKMDITTLSIDGSLTKKNYPLYLDEYEYYWVDNQLHHKKRDKPFTYLDPDRWKQLYINAGYDSLFESPKIELEYSLTFKRFKLKAEAGGFIYKNPDFYTSATLGYRLLK